MAEISTLNGYKIKDKKAVRYYENVDTMKNDSTLKEGMRVKTSGYHVANDGGCGDYKIVNDPNLSDDGGFVHALTNGLFATLIFNTPIDPKVLGAYGDGEHDDYNAIQNAILYGNVKLSKGTYYVSQAVNVGSNRIFDGNGATLISAEGLYAIEIIGQQNTPVNQVNIRDLVIDTTTNGGNGIDMQYTYFTYIDNINIVRLSRDGAIGINQVNGFNDTITNSRIIGNRAYNNTYGIKITTTSGGTANMTNNKYDTLLIQLLTYGIKANYSTTSNTNEFNNIGFSNNDYCYHISGYADPIKFSNTRMENTDNLSDTVGFYIDRSITSCIDTLNAYNMKKVIVNNGSTDKKMVISGAISLTGTSQSTKFLFIDSSTQNIYYNANLYMTGATYTFDKSDSFIGNAVLINGNGFLPAPSDLSSGSTTVSPDNKYIYKLTTANLSNLYGRKNSECMLYTQESNLKIVGTPSSLTNLGAELTLIPNRLYHIKFLDLNKFIVSE